MTSRWYKKIILENHNTYNFVLNATVIKNYLHPVTKILDLHLQIEEFSIREVTGNELGTLDFNR